MIKALSAVAIAAFIASAVTLLPGFTPRVEASVPAPLAKADRLDIKAADTACADQTWPNISAACLRRSAGNKTIKISQARVVTALAHH